MKPDFEKILRAGYRSLSVKSGVLGLFSKIAVTYLNSFVACM